MNLWMLRGALLTSCCVLVACSTNQQPAPPPSFSRPEQMAFACLDVKNGEVTARPLAKCKDPRIADANPRLHALVTQTSTGEVAAVDLGAASVLDIRPDVPGYTFIDVGMLPTSIVVPEKAAEFTYVGSATGEIGVFSTAAFRPLSDRNVIARAQEPAMRLPGLARPSSMVMTPDESALLVASESSGELFVVPICRDASVCMEGALLSPESVLLPTLPSASTPVRGPEGEPYVSTGTCENYKFLLAHDPTWGDAGTPSDNGSAGDAGMAQDGGQLADGGLGAISAARPAALAIDKSCNGAKSCVPTLLIADKAQPFIHRFEIRGSALSALEPWATGTPTEAIAVTPDVPVSLDGDKKTHYVYAIDHQDGSVFVLQDGAMLPVNGAIGERVDRLSFDGEGQGSRALSLAVMSPGKSQEICDVLGLPTTLRGVFLVAGLSSGHLLVYDIFDYDLTGIAQVTKGASTTDEESGTCRSCPFVIKRHQLRIGTTFSTFPEGSVIASTVNTAPRYFLGDRVFTVRNDGTTRDTRLPLLSCMPCPDGMTPAFPDPLAATSSIRSNAGGTRDGGMEDGSIGDASVADGGVEDDQGIGTCPDGQARICVETDPYLTSVGTWQANYEGVLPQSVGFGYFDAKARRFSLAQSTQDTLCRAGVLGSDVLGEQGDQLVIRSAPVEVAVGDDNKPKKPRCAKLQTALKGNMAAAAFAITRAYANHVEVDPAVISSAVADPEVRANLPKTLDELLGCYEGTSSATLLKFEVRSRNSFLLYALRGNEAEFDHRVVEEADGHCAVNESVSPELNGRLSVQVSADTTQPYNNGRLAFSLVSRGQDIPKDQPVILQITLGDMPAKLIYDASYRSSGSSTVGGVLLQALHYSPQDQYLYVVDPHLRGLVGIPTIDFLAGKVAGPFN